ncbi:UDP-Glycosyltransferase/glycogen phosphorylase [Coemansia reversa NRRL 1564]|uniref:GDP-Man:Man(3)GlcNAc(2)-PP-Dol alpha-1,2-mannosyltransferase n=1 Tax=Coemansia reversa (strain ATCC 12441 / NRRL 1564) TaxID=763665 RepID=A0A2G5BH08_COERN|nr:UDP-Glycosyltransferase/glycogen phosphorylase [Coemansia reversa NRRL 1564]|eukprot:PIA18007.1 UDP-Glycosyltransferase/glycogen phosphorylase [Coemansia reversa NRRL 1564]
MVLLESFIHYSLIAGLVLAVPIILALGFQVITLGTLSHQKQCRARVEEATSPDTSSHAPYYAGFFHPYPNAGGGGERVLWTMIKAIQDKYPFIVCVIYSGDSVTRETLVRNVQRKFGIQIRTESIYVVELSWRWWVDYKFPRFTLLMQSLGSAILVCQAFHRFSPDLFIDTVGFAFTYPTVALLSSKVPIVSYTHYPTISSDMQTMVSLRESGVNNDLTIARSGALTNLKSLYYSIFAKMYGFSGSFASTIMTNSSWTHAHIVDLFGKPRMTKVVYPPCDTNVLAKFPLSGRRPIIMSLAQFRPEKNHRLQVTAFAKFLNDHPEHVAPAGEKSLLTAELIKSLNFQQSEDDSVQLPNYPLLVILGGARNIEDEARAELLRQEAKTLGIDRQVHVIVNAPWSQVLDWLRLSKIGIHTMRDEHFGINIVEMMAAGQLTIAHDSAGPKLDIITPAVRCNSEGRPDMPDVKRSQAFLKAVDVTAKDTFTEVPEFPVGMLASDASEFAQMISAALNAEAPVEQAIRKAARHAATTRFSEAAFCTAFYKKFSPVVRWLDIQRLDDE